MKNQWASKVLINIKNSSKSQKMKPHKINNMIILIEEIMSALFQE